MCFLPELRGLGLGRTVLNRLLDRARALGYRQCHLETSDSMAEAQRLYERAGFRAMERKVGTTGYTSCNRWYLKELEGPCGGRGPRQFPHPGAVAKW